MDVFTQIGFDFADDEEFNDIVAQAFLQGTILPASKGRYIRYRDPSGAELWFQEDEENEFVGFNPHFEGKSRRKVVIMGALPRPGNPMDGTFYCWANPQNPDDPESGDYPFMFDLPNFWANQGLEFPLPVDIQLSAFAHELEIFEDLAAFNRRESEEPALAEKSFVPTGLFAGQERPSDTTPALGLFTGEILLAEKRINSLTDYEFWWMLVDTLGGTVDVLCEVAMLRDEPRVGMLMEGHFWLSGKVLERN